MLICAGPSAARDEARTRIDLQSPVSDNASSESDDEVLMFVLDLSDKILNTIEDKLLEQSGELLPGEIRDELRDSIGDILYEWCER